MNKFRVRVQSGKGEYFKDFEDLYVFVDGKEITLTDLYNKVKELEVRCEILEREAAEMDDTHKKIENVLTDAVSLLQKKVSRLETLLKD